MDGARNPVAACGLRRRACVVSLHAAVASAAAASAPPTSTIRPTSAGAREDVVDVVVAARAAAALEAAPVDLCGGVSGPPSAAHMRLQRLAKRTQNHDVSVSAVVAARQLCAENGRGRVHLGDVLDELGDAHEERGERLGSPALDSWLINWHSVHTMVSVTFSLGGEESEGGPGQKRWHPSEGRGVPRSARVGKREVGADEPQARARDEREEMGERANAERAAPREDLCVFLKRHLSRPRSDRISCRALRVRRGGAFVRSRGRRRSAEKGRRRARGGASVGR